MSCGLLISGCNSQGASGISDQLSAAANRLNLVGGDEQTVVYDHNTAEPYWVVAAPPATTPKQLADLGLPGQVSDSVTDCLKQSDAVIAVVETRISSCVWPVVFPEVAALFAVAKGSGEETQLVIRRKGRALQLIAIK